MNNILKKIVEAKKKRIKEQKERVPLSLLEKKCENLTLRHRFKEALKKKNTINIIAEYKKASPSAGVLTTAGPVQVATIYQEAGASAVSILTEEDFFKGSIQDLEEIRKAVHLPVLRKDFIVERYQVYESAVSGADAILLIVSILKKEEMAEFFKLAESLGLDVLTEVHSKRELDIGLESGAPIIGINNRNLEDFTVDIATTEKLMPHIPGNKFVVAESGIKSEDDAVRLQRSGVHGVLIGEYFLKAADIKKSVEQMVRAGQT